MTELPPAGSPDWEPIAAKWVAAWDAISPALRADWRQPWFDRAEEKPALRDGNPIFTAISDDQRRAIRGIELEPDSPFDCRVWFDWSCDGNIPDIRVMCMVAKHAEPRAMEQVALWISMWCGGLTAREVLLLQPIDAAKCYDHESRE